MKKITILLIAVTTFCVSHAQSWKLPNLSGQIERTHGITSFGFQAGQARPGTNLFQDFQSTAIGNFTLAKGPGLMNTAVGAYSISNNDGGSYNTAMGYSSLYDNKIGYDNTAIGLRSCEENESGFANTGLGAYSMNHNQTGNYNVAVGWRSLTLAGSSYYNTVVGSNSANSLNLGWNNTILGANSDGNFEGQYNIIAIGQSVRCPDNSMARIGNAATWSIGGFTSWSNFSDGRYKKDVKENVKGLDFIMKLRPVTYRLDITNISKALNESNGREWDESMKTAIADKEQVVYTGFVAQEVEQAAKEIQFDFSGIDKPRRENGTYALRYADFVVPIVKGMQEQQKMFNEQNEIIRQLQAKVESLEKQIKHQFPQSINSYR